MSDFHYLRNQYAQKLGRDIDDGKITDIEADELMEEWEAGYGDYMLDLMRDRELDAELAE